MLFCLHSVAILGPLMTEAMMRHPAWASWVKLVELFSFAIQHELPVGYSQRIDDLMLQHSALFDEVDQYVKLKRPKHHFASHLAIDAWKYGPPRGYWTMGFEAFNKVIKAGGRRSNMKCESMSIMEHWSMWSAWQMTSSEDDLSFWKL